MKDLKSDRCGSSAMEKKHTDGNRKALKDRQKRPDMQLYVPRALRRVENKTVSGKNVCAENVSQQDGEEIPKQSTTSGHTDSLDNLASVSSENELKKSSINLNVKPKNIKNESCNLVKLTTGQTVAECFIPDASNNATINETMTTSSNFPSTEKDNAQNIRNSSSDYAKMAEPCYSNCTKNGNLAVNTNAITVQNLIENIDEPMIEKVPSNTLDFKKEMDCMTASAPCEPANTKINFTVLEKAFYSSLDTKSEVSSITTSDSCYASDMDSLNISDEADLSLNTIESSGIPLKEKNDSWETMFNDDGECLDSNLVKELSSVTGKIQVRTAKNDYTDFQPLSESTSQEYEHIVELYSFPREFVTQDLISAFSVFQQSSFSIKWVDDCHALAIFTSPTLANQALQIKHPFIKVRPLSEGIKESKAKARWCAHHSEPPKPRPATSAMLARRLVSGALGLRVQATKEQRDYERTVLKEAKEKRRLKAKQKEAIWDGSVI